MISFSQKGAGGWAEGPLSNKVGDPPLRGIWLLSIAPADRPPPPAAAPQRTTDWGRERQREAGPSTSKASRI